MKKSWWRGLILLSLSCASSDSDWDSGAQRQEAFQNESQQRMEENTRDQFPTSKPNTEEPQPF